MRTTLRRSASRTRSFHRVCFFVVAFLVNGFYQRTSAQTSPTSTAPQADSDAAVKAAERKKRFAEAKKALEEQNPPVPQPKTQSSPSNPNSAAKSVSQPTAKIVFTMPMMMAVGETEHSYLYDEQRGKVTADAEWTAKDESSAADFSVVGGVPTLVGKGSGVVLVSAVLGDRSAVVTVTIVPRDQMTADGARWSYPSPQDHSSLKIVPSLPSSGPRR
jgi:cytoskeletal protein RodZ